MGAVTEKFKDKKKGESRVIFETGYLGFSFVKDLWLIGRDGIV
jgi:hypothetical protein